MKQDQNENMAWREKYTEKVKLGWSRIDKARFQRDFMTCQYEQVTEKFDMHGESINEQAMRDYFRKIQRGEKPATDEATSFANTYFQITRNNAII